MVTAFLGSSRNPFTKYVPNNRNTSDDTMNVLQPFQRSQHTTEVAAIGYDRFDAAYWPSIHAALQNCLESHSFVISTNGQVHAFVLVCPPLRENRTAFGVDSKVPARALEIAFIATATGWEGRGYARRLMEAVLFRCKTAQQSVWLHVDDVNPAAHAFYGRVGFRDFLHIPDPFGSAGWIMVYSPPHLPRPRWQNETIQRQALFNPTPCETEQSLGRCILPPPGMTCV